MAIENTNKLEVNFEFIKPYFAGKKKGGTFFKALDYYHHMSFHFDGYFVHVANSEELAMEEEWAMDLDKTGTDSNNPYFKRLIDLKRPSESDQIKSYRRLRYLPFTKRPLYKVYNSLRKIIKSPEWNISYDKVSIPSNVADNETLEQYCEHNFPRFNSVENWFYMYGMREMLNDANAFICILPMEKENEEDVTEYLRPVPYIYNSKDILDYKDGEYAVFVKSRRYKFGKTDLKRKGLELGVVTKDGYYEIRQINDKKDFEIVLVHDYHMSYLPAWRMGGIPKKISTHDVLYESFLAPMLPDLDEMASDGSDFQAEKTQHIFSTMWYFTQQDCKHCMGTGKVMNKGKSSIECTQCSGSGNAPKSPYRDMVLKAGSFDQQTMPTPPAGYIIKPTEIVKLFMDIMKDEEHSALSAVNHEFLAETPLVQSGTAKSYDRQEIQNFTYQVAYHSVEGVLNDIYYFVNEFRYAQLVSSEEQRAKMLPKIAIPENFDFIDTAMMESQLKAATDNKMDAMILSSMEVDYAAKNFPHNLELRDQLKLKNLLDPLPEMTSEEKVLLMGKSASQEDVVISSNIHTFIKRAMKENEKFPELEYQKQIEKLNEYAAEKIDLMSAANKVKLKQQQDLIGKQNPKTPFTPTN